MGMSILMVDDERNIRKTLSVCLQALGCAVTECDSSAAALEAIARLLILSARAISESVPNSPPTAMIASAEPTDPAKEAGSAPTTTASE